MADLECTCGWTGNSWADAKDHILGVMGDGREHEVNDIDDIVSKQLRDSLVTTLISRGASPVEANKMANMAEAMGKAFSEEDEGAK